MLRRIRKSARDLKPEPSRGSHDHDDRPLLPINPLCLLSLLECSADGLQLSCVIPLICVLCQKAAERAAAYILPHRGPSAWEGVIGVTGI
mmetsp:Transcript_18304/g.45652  ORF Transcript_18304/g.45652 Transcript_18304/m.45652 type:complete len:90 (-) Transcript_18304:321-590(-)